MAIELKVPEVGESVTEVEIGEWLKQVGDEVQADEGIVMIETDKVTVELPAPVSGKITEIVKAQGEVCQVGEVVALMEAGEVSAGAPAQASTAATAATAKTTAKTTAPPSAPAATGGHVMPAAARLAAERGVDASQVAGTGPGGRVLKEDVAAAKKAPPKAAPQKAAALPAPSSGGAREEEIVPMTPLRRRVAERLVQAQQSAALLTTFNEVDMSAVMALRKAHKDAFLSRYDVKLGFMSFFVKAAVEALKLVPQVNAEIRGTDIVYKNYFDIGVAVGGGKGLVVPVLRNTQRMSFAQIESTIGELARKAKANQITLDDLTGGTFTISNGGVYGSMLSTPIVNPPQSGILGLHNIQERAVVVDGAIVARPMMYVALTYDHRIVDGREAVTFLKRIKECIEAPARMLLEI